MAGVNGVRSLLALALVVATVSAVTALPPIPVRYSGFSQGGQPIGSGDQVWIEGFLDLTCPDSKASWPTIKSVLAAYDNNLPFTFHLFPLPYLHFGFFAAQGTYIVQSVNSSAVFPWIDAMFAAQPKFSTPTTNGTSADEVVKQMAAIAATVGVPESTFMAGMTWGGKFWDSAATAWKYGASRHVYGTPTYMVNGVPVAADGTWTVSQWQALLNPLVNSVNGKEL